MAERKSTGRDGGTGRTKLKRYLCRYFKARERRAILQDRLDAIGRQGGQDGALAERVRLQAAEEEQIALDTQAIIDLLPVDSMERTILELRHIDCKPWRDIREAIHYAKTPCFNYYNKGLDTLLTDEKVQGILDSWEVFSSGKKPGRVPRLEEG